MCGALGRIGPGELAAESLFPRRDRLCGASVYGRSYDSEVLGKCSMLREGGLELLS